MRLDLERREASSASSSGSGSTGSGGTTSSSSSGLHPSSSSVATGNSTGSTGSIQSGGSTSPSGSTSSSGGATSTAFSIPDNAGCVLADGGPAVYCSARCTDTGSDIQNCGACHVVCPNGSCVGGSCLLVSCAGLTGGGNCELGDGGPDGGRDGGSDGGPGTCCNGSCFSKSQFQTDADNCGSCGFGCVTGATCKAGACTLPGTTNQGLCGPCTGTCTKGSCSTTGLHCGACPTGEVCIDADPNYGGLCVGDTCTKKANGVICELGTSAAPNPGMCCGATCVDYNTDAANCGGCGAACQVGQLCVQGVCTSESCGPNDFFCALDGGQLGSCCGGAGCVDTTTDLANCGGCGTLCPTGSTSCKNGSCLLRDGGATCTLPASGCPSGSVCDAFPTGLNGPVTTGSSCTPTTCAADGAPCYLNPATTGLCCGGSCVNPSQDPANCGGCGLVCPSGICVAGAAGLPQYDAIVSNCLPPSPPTSSDCSQSGGCPKGWSCIDDLCLPPDCISAGLCAVDGGNPGVCCTIAGQGYCVDVANDPNNCGGCGSYCPFGQTCSHGVCSGTQAPCSAGNVNDACNLAVGPLDLCCPGEGCVNTLTDPANCGGCGVACGDGGSCAAGVCG